MQTALFLLGEQDNAELMQTILVHELKKIMAGIFIFVAITRIFLFCFKVYPEDDLTCASYLYLLDL